jgi:hypothetical protein
MRRLFFQSTGATMRNLSILAYEIARVFARLAAFLVFFIGIGAGIYVIAGSVGP